MHTFESTPQLLNFGKNDHISVAADAKSNRLRSAYRAGQRVFRTILIDRRPTVDDFHDQLSVIDSQEERDGFSMGWQSDNWAVENGKQLSWAGVVRYVPEDLNEPFTTKVDTSLVESGSD